MSELVNEAAIYNTYTMRSLISQLEALQKEMKLNKDVSEKTNLQLEEYTKTLKSIADEKGYDDLTDDQKSAISAINDTLPQINKLAHNLENSAWKKARANFENPDEGAMKILDNVSKAVINSSAYLKLYLKSSKNKTAPKHKKTGNTEDNKKMNVKAKEAETFIKSAVKPVATRLRTFSTSLNVKPKAISSAKTEDESSEGMTNKLDYLAKGVSAFGTALSGFNNAVGQFIGALGSAYSAVAQGFGDMLDDPISGVISAMNGMSSMITSSMGFFTSLLDTISGIFTSIFSGGKDDDDEGGNSSKITAIATAILSIISSLISAALQSIQAGLQIFTSTLQAVFKIVKKIAFTSPVVKAILELLNLAFTLFFMPFMNSFALVLLPYVLELLDWAVTNGAQYAEWGAVLGQSLANLLTVDGGIMDQVKTLAISFITDFLPSFLALLPELISFAIAFVRDILSNKESIINFLHAGFQAFSAMLEAGILSSFLDFGKKTMEWLGNNAPQLVIFIASVMEGLLRIAKFFAGFTGGSSEIEDIDVESITVKAEALANEMKKYTGDTAGKTENGDDVASKLANLAYAADGGKFPCNGGIPVISGEGGEGEYKLSESELKEIGKDTTVSIQYNGQILSKYDFKETVRKALTDVSSKSYYR